MQTHLLKYMTVNSISFLSDPFHKLCLSLINWREFPATTESVMRLTNLVLPVLFFYSGAKS